MLIAGGFCLASPSRSWGLSCFYLCERVPVVSRRSFLTFLNLLSWLRSFFDDFFESWLFASLFILMSPFLQGRPSPALHDDQYLRQPETTLSLNGVLAAPELHLPVVVESPRRRCYERKITPESMR